MLNSEGRLITGTKKFEHISRVVNDLHWLTIDKRILFKLLCLTFEALSGLAPHYLTDQLNRYAPTQTLRSADQGLLCVPMICTKKYAARAFAYAAPSHYNAIPLDIRQSTTFPMFKNQLKTYFFRVIYSLSSYCVHVFIFHVL